MTAGPIFKFPDKLKRRLDSRRPRRSKNGTPEERAAKAAAQPPKQVVDLKRQAAAKRPRRSKNGTPEERAAKRAAAASAAVLDLAAAPRPRRTRRPLVPRF